MSFRHCPLFLGALSFASIGLCSNNWWLLPVICLYSSLSIDWSFWTRLSFCSCFLKLFFSALLRNRRFDNWNCCFLCFRQVSLGFLLYLREMSFRFLDILNRRGKHLDQGCFSYYFCLSLASMTLVSNHQIPISDSFASSFRYSYLMTNSSSATVPMDWASIHYFSASLMMSLLSLRQWAS